MNYEYYMYMFLNFRILINMNNVGFTEEQNDIPDNTKGMAKINVQNTKLQSQLNLGFRNANLG